MVVESWVEGKPEVRKLTFAGNMVVAGRHLISHTIAILAAVIIFIELITYGLDSGH